MSMHSKRGMTMSDSMTFWYSYALNLERNRSADFQISPARLSSLGLLRERGKNLCIELNVELCWRFLSMVLGRKRLVFNVRDFYVEIDPFLQLAGNPCE